MKNLNTAICKQAIVDFIISNPGCIKRLWDPWNQAGIDETEIANVKVWKRDSKRKIPIDCMDGGCWERFFRATSSQQEEVADQVTATVVSDENDEKILHIFFEG